MIFWCRINFTWMEYLLSFPSPTLCNSSAPATPSSKCSLSLIFHVDFPHQTFDTFTEFSCGVSGYFHLGTFDSQAKPRVRSFFFVWYKDKRWLLTIIINNNNSRSRIHIIEWSQHQGRCATAAKDLPWDG